MNIKFIRKYMKLAKAVADDNDACYSRKIGIVIVDNNHKVKGVGYNGPPAGTAHCDEEIYLREFFIPQLTEIEKERLIEEYNLEYINQLAYLKRNCNQCPRRFIKAGPGERSTLCSCQHAERNAITNAACDLSGATMFCWCGVPCIDCTGAIVNARIGAVHCLDVQDYHPVSRFLFKEAGITVTQHNPNTVLQ